MMIYIVQKIKFLFVFTIFAIVEVKPKIKSYEKIFTLHSADAAVLHNLLRTG